MILYLSPGACSLADHIALHEADLSFERVKVDLKAKKTEDGEDYLAINPKGYVPFLVLDDGQTLSENVAILSWIADQAPHLKPKGELAGYHLLETLAYVSTELHKSFGPFFAGADADAKAAAAEKIERRLRLLAPRVADGYLFGPELSVADPYLFVMLTWAGKNGLPLSAPLSAFVERMKARPSVKMALEHEGLA